jgi:hypothetical protein
MEFLGYTTDNIILILFRSANDMKKTVYSKSSSLEIVR